MQLKKLTIVLAFLSFSLAADAQTQSVETRRSIFLGCTLDSTNIIFLGDSITSNGEWQEYTSCPKAVNRGISGDRACWMLEYKAERLDPIAQAKPKAIFLMIGTNDLAAGRTAEQVTADIRTILRFFREKTPQTRLYYQSILPVNGEEFTKFKNHYPNNPQIEEINEELKKDEGTLYEKYIDLASQLRNGEGLLDSVYTNDGLHILSSGYKVWIEQVQEYLK